MASSALPERALKKARSGAAEAERATVEAIASPAGAADPRTVNGDASMSIWGGAALVDARDADALPQTLPEEEATLTTAQLQGLSRGTVQSVMKLLPVTLRQ